MRKNAIQADMSRLEDEVDALMFQANIVVLTRINSYWMSNLRVVLSSLAASQDRGDWDFRYDDEDVCILWAAETCRLLTAGAFLSFPSDSDMKNFWLKGLRCLFGVCRGPAPFHYVIATHSKNGPRNDAERVCTVTGWEAFCNKFKREVARALMLEFFKPGIVAGFTEKLWAANVLGDWNIPERCIVEATDEVQASILIRHGLTAMK